MNKLSKITVYANRTRNVVTGFSLTFNLGESDSFTYDDFKDRNLDLSLEETEEETINQLLSIQVELILLPTLKTSDTSSLSPQYSAMIDALEHIDDNTLISEFVYAD